MPQLDYSPLRQADAESVKRALSDGKRDIIGYMSAGRLAFLTRNFRQLASLGLLERNWMQTYLHASHLNAVPLSTLREIFDACDKRVLQKDWPIPDLPCLYGGRLSLFRGCAGPVHRKGMSWVPSLDKAIWYAAHHAACHEIANPAVYAATVEPAEIYCCGNHYDYDFIACPKEWWRIDVPIAEFKIDRPR